MRKQFYISNKDNRLTKNSFLAVNRAFLSASEKFYKKKKELHEKFPALEKKSMKDIFKWAFANKKQEVYLFNMDQFRTTWNNKFPKSKLSKGKAGALSEGEISFIIREYVRIGALEPKTHIEQAIDKTIKVSYMTREIINQWKNT